MKYNVKKKYHLRGYQRKGDQLKKTERKIKGKGFKN